MIIGMIPTYREGPLVQDAITSLEPICNSILAFEGPVGDAPLTGIPTEFPKRSNKLIIKSGEWKSEIHKRNTMLEFTRRFPTPTWGIFLDADEVLLYPEYLLTYIWAGDMQAEEGTSNAAMPLLRVEVDGSVQQLHRIIRLDLLERHVLSMSQWKFFNQDIIVTFPAIPYDRTPNQGEPHVFHRAFYRPKGRGDFRLSEKEIEEFHQLEEETNKRLGISTPAGTIPKAQDPGFIVAREIEK